MNILQDAIMEAKGRAEMLRLCAEGVARRDGFCPDSNDCLGVVTAAALLREKLDEIEAIAFKTK